ncbi:MAG TPA: PrsW family intramembrane metalloprotease [Chloroflexota bacterium]|nr:PrsW family intramembrane metalloprotease [Chloroflexota bacterium]
MILAVVAAVAIPLVFLYLVRWLDLYASGSFRLVVLCLVWGCVAFALAYNINTLFVPLVGYGLIVTLVAPIVEECLKSLVLLYLVRRPQFTYFVDGAIYGFASGTAFAVLENLLYLSRASADMGIIVVLSRAFSTSLMHGSASAMVGVSLGRFRFARGASRPASLVLGWLAAMAIHITFNHVISGVEGTLALILAVVLGLGGIALTVAFIMWGLAEERKWLQETLGSDAGVSQGESALVQKMADLDLLMAPVEERFGSVRRKQVERFLQLQVQLGLKSKAQTMTQDGRQSESLTGQIEELRTEMDEIRRTVGVYCMSYVRSILPPTTEPVWDRLTQSLEGQNKPAPTRSLWSALGDKMDASDG